MTRTVLYPAIVTPANLPPPPPGQTPQGFSAFFDPGRPPASAAQMPFEANWRFPVPSTPVPHGWESAGGMFPERFAAPFPAYEQQWDAFVPERQIVSVTPQGFSAFFDAAKIPPFPAYEQQWDAFQPRAIISVTPQGFSAFFDAAKIPPFPAYEQQWDAFVPERQIVSVTPQGFSAFFDAGRQPPSAANLPFEVLARFAIPTAKTPQGFSAFFDPGRQPPSAANQKFDPFYAFGPMRIMAYCFGLIIG